LMTVGILVGRAIRNDIGGRVGFFVVGRGTTGN
jgi:hypothetical protein